MSASIHPTEPAGRYARSTGSSRARLYVLLSIALFIVIALIDTRLRHGPALGSRDMKIDPAFRIPAPPREGLPFDRTKDLIGSAALIVVGLVAVALAVRDGLRTRSWLPVLVACSGVAIVIPEAFVDFLGGVYMVDGPHIHTITLLGRQMGGFILAGWFAYGGAFTYLCYRVMTLKPRTKALWLLFLANAIGDVVFEEFLLSLGLYHYYGNQPLVLLHLLPWWWIPCNSVGCFLAAALAYRYRETLQGWRSIAMFVITPISVMGIYGFIAMPSFIAVDGHYPWLLTQVLGLVTLALGVLAFAVILEVVLRRRPFDLDSTPADDAGAAPESAGTLP